MAALIPKGDFLGIEGVAHLAAAGETPVLADSLEAVSRFAREKGTGMPARDRMYATADRVRGQLAEMLGGSPDDVALLWNATAGLHAVAMAVDWSRGGNVVVAASEFPTVLHVWEGGGLDVRRVGVGPVPTIEEYAAAVTPDTRVVVASHVSYLTGARSDLAALRGIVDGCGARLVVDASHALGAVPVDGSLCDVVVSCCYKWLLGTHGVGVFYVNSDRWPDIEQKVVGWNSVLPEVDWRKRTAYELKPSLRRFESGNPSFMSVCFLENGLARLLGAGIGDIEAHVLELGGELWKGLGRLGVDILTPEDPAARAGNICFQRERSEELEASLREMGVLTWGGDNRLRISVHAYNDAEDVGRCLDALGKLLA